MKTKSAAAKLAAAPLDRNSKIAATLSRKDFPVGVPHDEDNLVHRSGRQGVVSKVHDICDRLIKGKGKTRKDVLARCRKLGIAEYTARTQYQRWMNPPKPKAAKKAAKAK